MDDRINFYVYILGLASIIFISLIIVIFQMRKNFRDELSADKMYDFDSMGGNLYNFEHSFRTVISDKNRTLYYILYISIDTNLLHMYHGEVVLKDAIRFTSNALASYTSKTSFSAKISESGFAIAFPANNQSEAEATIREIIGKLNLYIEQTDHHEKQYYTASVYNLRQNDVNSEILLYNLRKKCLDAVGKENQVIYCNESMMNSITAEKEFLEDILLGLNHNEFQLYVQFIVDSKTKKIVSAEALSRWDSRKHGLTAPGRYIGALEQSGYISKLDYYMFEACCRLLHKWRDTDFGSLTLSCNITRTTISETDFSQKISEIAERYIFDREKLFIEITEETIEDSFENAIENVKFCKKLGFGISLDDMGTGYTTLSNLCDYPIDIVKIDREILLKTDTANGKGLFRGIISLSHSLGMKTICEGVETEEQKTLVEETDCDMIQGFYYSKTYPIKKAEEFAREYFKNS